MSEESRRRERILRQIREKQNVVRICEKEKAVLEKQKKKQESCRDQWVLQEQIKKDVPILDLVLIPGIYQGDSAEQMRVPIMQGFEQMTLTKQELADELNDLQQQIEKVQNYIDQLEDEIRILYNRL